MGKLCSKQTQSVSTTIETEQEITIPQFKSEADKDYEQIESKYNYLRKVNYLDFLHSLVQFSNENATLEDDYSMAKLEHSSEESFFSELFSTDILQSFVENKILKHKQVYKEAGENEKVTSIFKEFLFAANNGLALKLTQDFKAKYPDKEAPDKTTIVKKGDVISYGLLFCVGPNYAKVRSIFNLFREGDIIKKSEKLSIFLLTIFLVASYGMANARNKCSKYEEIGGIDSERLRTLLNCSELQDCNALVDFTEKELFGANLDAQLSYDEFKAKFAEKDKEKCLGFMFSPNGVRYMLQQHNVD